MSVRLAIDEVFQFEDGRVVFAGDVFGDSDLLLAGRAVLSIDGVVTQVVMIGGEMLGVRRPGTRAVWTRDVVPVEQVRSSRCELIWNR